MSNLLQTYQLDWYEASARERIAGLLDAKSFAEFLGPEQRATSPHLAQFDLTGAFDDGIVVGRGRLDGQEVFVAAQDGRFLGGAFGEVHGAKLVGLLRAARDGAGPGGLRAVLLLLDTGGVRLQEANAGELAISEVVNAIVQVRRAGIPVLALVGGRAGAFGGGGIITASCSRIVVSEHARVSVSGPEVIETNKGVEEFDSKDRALVWRVCGARTRYLTGGADFYVKGRIRISAKRQLRSPKMRRPSNSRRFRPSSGGWRSACNASAIAATHRRSGVRRDCRSRSTSLRSRTTRSSPLNEPKEQIMTLDDVLASLFPSGHKVERGPSGTLHGTAKVEGHSKVTVVGIVGGTPLGVDGAILLAGHVLAAVEADDRAPIVFLVDTASQNMARRDELLGLNEYIAHLYKSLALASLHGHRTVSVLFGHAAAGAFIASALSSQSLVTLPGAAPSVMDLPSISRVTKLPLEQLQELAKSTPIFAPGVEPLFATGAVTQTWAAGEAVAPRLADLLRQPVVTSDHRDQIGLERKGRLLAQKIAERVAAEAADHA